MDYSNSRASVEKTHTLEKDASKNSMPSSEERISPITFVYEKQIRRVKIVLLVARSLKGDKNGEKLRQFSILGKIFFRRY